MRSPAAAARTAPISRSGVSVLRGSTAITRSAGASSRVPSWSPHTTSGSSGRSPVAAGRDHHDVRFLGERTRRRRPPRRRSSGPRRGRSRRRGGRSRVRRRRRHGQGALGNRSFRSRCVSCPGCSGPAIRRVGVARFARLSDSSRSARPGRPKFPGRYAGERSQMIFVPSGEYSASVSSPGKWSAAPGSSRPRSWRSLLVPVAVAREHDALAVGRELRLLVVPLRAGEAGELPEAAPVDADQEDLPRPVGGVRAEGDLRAVGRERRVLVARARVVRDLALPRAVRRSSPRCGWPPPFSLVHVIALPSADHAGNPSNPGSVVSRSLPDPSGFIV